MTDVQSVFSAYSKIFLQHMGDIFPIMYGTSFSISTLNRTMLPVLRKMRYTLFHCYHPFLCDFLLILNLSISVSSLFQIPHHDGHPFFRLYFSHYQTNFRHALVRNVCRWSHHKKIQNNTYNKFSIILYFYLHYLFCLNYIYFLA